MQREEKTLKMSRQRTSVMTNREQCTLHSFPLIGITKPPLRPPIIAVLPKRIPIPMRNPCAHPNHRSALQRQPADHRALGRDFPFERKAKGRMQTSGFIYARGEVREVMRLLPRGERVQLAVVGRFVELGEEGFQGRGVG